MKIKENYAAIERTVALVKEKFGADKITIEVQTARSRSCLKSAFRIRFRQRLK